MIPFVVASAPSHGCKQVERGGDLISEIAPVDRHLLRHIRLMRGLTQSELGHLVGAGVSAIAHYEMGRRVPRPGVARRLREFMEAGEVL